MKSLRLTSLLCGGVLSLTATNALAQQPSSSQPGSTQLPSTSQSSQSQYGQSSQGQAGQSQYGQGSQGQSSRTPGQGQSSTLGQGTSGIGQSSSALGSGAMQSDNAVRLSELMRANVQSQEGKTLGNIRDITVDPQSGRIEFAILSLSSAGAATDTSTSGRETVPSSRSSTAGTPSVTAGATSGKLIPVPWQLFSQSRSSLQQGASTTPGAGSMGSQNLVLNVDESKLRTAPSFDAGNWNQLQTGALSQRVYSHFGVDESSAIGTPGSSIRGQGTSGSTDPSTLPGSQHQQGTQGIHNRSSTSTPGSTTPGSGSTGGSSTGTSTSPPR
ncbi:MAG: PRC-barrel domain-containing protein [Verrucomicrobiia bacterium]